MFAWIVIQDIEWLYITTKFFYFILSKKEELSEFYRIN